MPLSEVALKPAFKIPLHTLSREILLTILVHAPEASRVKSLLTCKDLSILLTKRSAAARAAFDGFVAELKTMKGVNWSFDAEANKVIIKEKDINGTSVRTWDFYYILGPSSIIGIYTVTNFTSAGKNCGGWQIDEEFHPWMRTKKTERDPTRRIKNDEDLGLVYTALLRSSPSVL